MWCVIHGMHLYDRFGLSAWSCRLWKGRRLELPHFVCDFLCKLAVWQLFAQEDGFPLVQGYCGQDHRSHRDDYSCRSTAPYDLTVSLGHTKQLTLLLPTTIHAVCGLVILELFKLVLQKDTDAYMNRQIALAVNRFTSYTQEKPISYETKTEITPPSTHDCTCDSV